MSKRKTNKERDNYYFHFIFFHLMSLQDKFKFFLEAYARVRQNCLYTWKKIYVTRVQIVWHFI